MDKSGSKVDVLSFEIHAKNQTTDHQRETAVIHLDGNNLVSPSAPAMARIRSTTMNDFSFSRRSVLNALTCSEVLSTRPLYSTL